MQSEKAKLSYDLDIESAHKVLLIEDNIGDARLVELLLGESELIDCEIVNKTTLEEGLKSLSEDVYSVVLLDLSLPDSRGFETLEKLLQSYPEANVIVLTGLADKTMGIKAVQAGAQDFLIKGAFDSGLLAKSLRYSIERSTVLQRLEEAQRTAHIGNWEYKFNGEQLKGSDEVYRILGFVPRTEVTLEMVASQISPEDVQEIKQKALSAKSGEVFSRDIRLTRSSGEIRHVYVQGQAIFNRNEIVGLKGIVQDITQRKEAALSASKNQERYQAVFTQSNDAIYIATPEGQFIDFNQATEKLFGYERKELEGMDVRQFFAGEEGKKVVEQLQRHSNIKDFEINIKRKDGEVRYCELTASRLNTTAGEVDGYHAILRDITERKLTEDLKRAKDLAERSAKMKEEFLARVTHDMRTPMNSIMGFANLTLGTELNEEQLNYVSTIKHTSEILLAIIQDILDFSKLEFGEVEFDKEKIDLNELLQNLAAMFRGHTEEKGLEFKLDIGKNVHLHLLGDERRLNQILINLLGNAMKFTEHGFIKINVRNIKDDEQKTRLQFQVEDTGIGIPDDKLDVIFSSFTKIRHKNKIYEGTGLGLSIVKRVLDLQNGTISVASAVGKGSVFTFELEFEKDLSGQKANTDESEPDNLPNRPISILLAEDLKLNQIVAKKTIEKKYPEVELVIAENGKIAIDLLKERDFDLILMDIMMPVMDGYEASEYIRQNMPSKATMPILAMTAHAHIAEDKQYLRYGMNDFVLKPFKPKQLYSKIAEYINKKDNGDMNPQETTPTGAPAYQHIDLSYMDLMSDGDPDMKKTMLEMLFDEPIAEMHKMKELEEQKDWTELKAVSHKMKSTLSFVGNELLTNTNKKIEQIAISQENTGELPQLIATLTDNFSKALEELRQEHGRL